MNENDFVVGVLTYITCLREKKRYSTAKSYQDALNSFKCFCGREEIPYAYINPDTLLRYQSWLLTKGCSRNTVSTYMRRIRHIYNLAVEAGEATYIPHLFKNVFTGVESKRNSPDRSTKSTRLYSYGTSTVCKHRVSGSLSLPSRGPFHLSFTVLCSIGH